MHALASIAHRGAAAAAALLALALATPAPGGENEFKPENFFETTGKGKVTKKQKVAIDDQPLLGTVRLVREKQKGSGAWRVEDVVFTTGPQAVDGVRFVLHTQPQQTKYLDETRPPHRGEQAMVGIVGIITNRVTNKGPRPEIRPEELYDYVSGTLESREAKGGPEWWLKDDIGGGDYAYPLESGKKAKDLRKFLEAHKDGDKVNVLGTFTRKAAGKPKRGEDRQYTYELTFHADYDVLTAGDGEK